MERTLLPQSLVEDLKARGICFPHEPPRPLDLASAEKSIFKAKRTQNGVLSDAVVLYSRWDGDQWAWNYQQEVTILKRLREANCKHIVQLYEFMETTGPERGPCMVMEAVSPVGWDLLHVARTYYCMKRSRMPIAEAQRYFFQVAEALKFLHKLRLVHCDVKGENVVCGGPPDFVAKLIDFGFCRDVGCILGTCRQVYMAPEHGPNAAANTPLDMFGLGYVLWQIWAGMGMPDCLDSNYQRYWLKSILKAWKIPEPVICEALEGLLCFDASARWTFEQLSESKFMQPWPVSRDSRTLEESDIVVERTSTWECSQFVQYCNFTLPTTCFAQRVTADSKVST